MIRINLMPFRAARKKENIRRQVSIFFLSFLFVIMVLVYYNISLSREITNIQDNVARTKKELTKYNKINKEIQEIKKKLALLEKKTDVIKKLEMNRFEPVQLLDTMTDKVIAKRMWFTQFQAKGDQIRIDGIALDNKTVADFMTRLESTGLFSSVNLKKIQKKDIKGSSLKSFQISCVKPVSLKPEKNKTEKSKQVRKK